MSTGFSFGANTSAQPTFGTGSITFGTPATQPAQQFGFGNPASTAPNLFGTQTPQTTAPLAFQNPGFATPATTPSTGGFSFGAATPSFGAPTTAPATGFGFGTPASTTGLTFGTPATTATSLSLGIKPPAFGTPTTSTQAVAPLSLGAQAPGFGFGATTAIGTPATGLSLGTTTAPGLGLSFGTTTTAPSLNFGGTTTSAGFSFGGTGALLGGATSTPSLSLPATTQQNVGLGGVAFTQSKTGTTSSTQKELPPKEQLLPNEFSQLVEQFKNAVQEEKNRSSDVSRCPVKEYHKVEEDLELLTQQFNQVENQLKSNRTLAEQLKFDTAKGLQNIELAHRTQDTPPSLQYDNTAPMQFFLELADTLEKETQMLKQKIDNTEKYIKKLKDPVVLTSEDLASGLKRLNETFIALAGRMQSIHSQVEAQKEAYLSLSKKVFKNESNPFEKLNKNPGAMNTVMRSALKSLPTGFCSGPTPFNSITLGSNNLSIAPQQTPATPFQAANSTLGFGLGNTSFGNIQPSNTSLFQTPLFGSGFQANTSNNFQLQKPPTGNKRGKQ